MIRKSLTFLTIFISLLVLTVNSAAATNYSLTRELLLNGGFEQEESWQAFGNGGYSYVTDEKHGGVKALKVVSNAAGQNFGAYQRVDLNQAELLPVNFTGWVKGEGIVNGSGGYMGGALYAEIVMNDGSVAYWNTIINTGSFGWRPVGFSIGNLPTVNKPISHIFVVATISNATGTAWFDDLHLTEYKGNGAAVTFMFDDGEDNVLLAKQVLDEKGYKASAPIPVNHVGEAGYVTRDQIRQLISGGWEVMAHGMDHSDMTVMSITRLRTELQRPINYFRNNFNGLVIKNVAWPFGAYNGLVISEARRAGYRSGRAYELSNTGSATLPFDVKVRSLEQGVAGSTVDGWLNEAKSNNQWVVLVGHGVKPQGEDKYFVTEAQLREIVNAVAGSGLSVVTYDQGLNLFAAEGNPAVVAAAVVAVTPTPTLPAVGGTIGSGDVTPTITSAPTSTPTPTPATTSGNNVDYSQYRQRIEELLRRQLERRG